MVGIGGIASGIRQCVVGTGAGHGARRALAAQLQYNRAHPPAPAVTDAPPPTAAPTSGSIRIPEIPTSPCPLAVTLARRLREAQRELTARWLERIVERVSIDPNRIFPTEELLDHVPLLIAGVADYVEDPARAVAADSAVVAKAMELGALRHAQGFDAYEVLKEYEILGGILYAHLSSLVDDIDEQCTRAELFDCAHRIFHAIAQIEQATAVQYFRRTTERLYERDERLRAFNRTLAHEFRNRIGAASGAAHMLGTMDLADADRRELAGVVERNVDSMRTTLEHLLELSRVNHSDVRQQRHVRLPRAAAEAVRQLRDLARAHAVEVRIHPLPDVEVNAAAVELCLTNLVSNAIKYSDPAKRERWVDVTGETSAGDGQGPEVVVRVSDNGLGVPETHRGGLFRRFFRAHEHSATHVEGTGLGLSIVRETVRALGGRVWADFPDVGAVFAFALPARRGADVGRDGGRA
jgi:signal transduction histidine kinase